MNKPTLLSLLSFSTVALALVVISSWGQDSTSARTTFFMLLCSIAIGFIGGWSRVSFAWTMTLIIAAVSALFVGVHFALPFAASTAMLILCAAGSLASLFWPKAFTRQ